MPEITGRIDRTDSPDSAQSSSLSKDANSRYHQQGIDRNLLRRPDTWVFIFSVSKREFPSAHQLVRVGVKACEPEQRYRLVAKLPDPYQWSDIEQTNGSVIARNDDARRVAQDYCNPANTSINQDLVVPSQNIFGFGNNLTKQGVFWTEKKHCTFAKDDKEQMHPIPPEADILKAEQRVETYYRGLLEEARTLELANPKELENTLTMDYHMAAEYFGEVTSWHKRQVRAIVCTTCGELKPTGHLIHRNSISVCIDPSQEGWRLAVNSGLKKMDEVPEDFQWKKAKVEAKKEA